MPISSADRAPSADTGRPGARLELAGIAAGYGAAPVISDVSLTVGAGEIVAVVGPNGAGKSTLLKTVLGILHPSRGSISLDGQRIDRLSTTRVARRGIGYVPQVRDVFEPLTVRENLEMGGYTIRRGEIAARLDEVFAVFPELSVMAGRMAGYLSGGERKLLAMGRVLMRRPGLLVLDEPTAGLAPKLAQELLTRHVTELATGGTAVLLVEQHTRDALGIAHWAYVMASGQVRLAGPAAEVGNRADLSDIFLGHPATR
jgi:ABC-type branched-subunit amino acid transport system ATPase component